MKRIYFISLLLLVVLSSCGSKHKKNSETTAEPTAVKANTMEEAEARTLFDKVVGNASSSDNLVAKVHVELDLNGESNSTSGTLRMRKGEVIQISLVDPFLGVMELGKLTFTPTEVLVLVRVKKQYVRVPYSQVSFLQKANINFNSLQALFWHELFEPGRQVPRMEAFSFIPENDNASINFTDNLLAYNFTTDKTLGLISKTEVTGAKDTRYKLWFDYSDFTTFAKKQFPKNINLSFTDGTKASSLKLELSSLKNNADWEYSTTVPEGYERLNFEKIFNNLLSK